MTSSHALLISFLCLSGFVGFGLLGASMQDALLDEVSASSSSDQVTGGHPGVGRVTQGAPVAVSSRSMAGVLSGLKALISPRVSFVRGVDGLFREAASMGSSKFVDKARVSGEAVLRSDADVLRWLGEGDNTSIEKITFRREPFWFSPMVRKATHTDLEVTVPAKRAGDDAWLGQHLASGLAKPYTRVKHSIPDNLFTKRESGNWITAGWASGAVLGATVGFVGGGPVGAALAGTLGALGNMFVLPITREALMAFPLEHRLGKLAHSLRGKLSPGDTLTLKANGRTLDNLSVTIEPNSFPNRQPSLQTIQLDGVNAQSVAAKIDRQR